MVNYDNYVEIGKNKIKNKWCKTFILAILAGVFIALAGAGSVIVSYKMANPSVAKLLSGIIFPIGLILVILFQTELFTGNSLLVIPYLKKEISLKKLLKNWIIVYLGNFTGAVLISILLYLSGIFNNSALSLTYYTTMLNKVSLSFVNALVLGILCNFLVCIAVFLASNAKTLIEKILVIFIPICLFIILGFEHSIANMYFLSMGFLSSFNESISFWNILLNNLLPVTLGNIIGGVTFASIIYYLNRR